LALAFQRGDHEAYETIYELYAPRVESVCFRMLGDSFDAQEAAQETFLRVYQSLPRFNGRYHLGAWIARIATNICLDHIRSRARKPSDATPLEILDLESDPADVSDPEHLYIRNTEARRVKRVLASLPPLHRAAIVLRDFEGLCYQDIASALDLTETQVKALIHRARKGFRKTWNGGGLAALLPRRRRLTTSTEE
jgi:RNA polymerase sigma-70 factor, ECF subfamily